MGSGNSSSYRLLEKMRNSITLFCFTISLQHWIRFSLWLLSVVQTRSKYWGWGDNFLHTLTDSEIEIEDLEGILQFGLF